MARHKQDPDEADRIWIELEWPVDCGDRTDEVAKRRAEAATKVLRKLGDPQSGFFWNEEEQRYFFDFGGGGGYTELEDHGRWMNLTFMAK